MASGTPSVAIVLTLSHKTTYSTEEEFACRHARRYLSGHDLFVLLPRSHDASYPGFRERRFDDRYFGSAAAHGALLLSRRFYEAFRDYDFVLIHHLDALAFSDQLQRWCAAGYDYIGAPWLISPATPHIHAEKVGNGGFSLRRVSSFMRVLESRRHWLDPEEYWRAYAARTGPFRRALNLPRRYLKRVGALNGIRWHIRWSLKGGVHEDRFWAEFATHYDPAFRIAPVEEAMQFAVEAEPRRCCARIGGLPFGAHRWATFDRAFFEPYLLTTGPGSLVHPGNSRRASRGETSFAPLGAR